MNIKELIKEHHGAMVEKGFYDCPDCTERLKLKKELGAGCHDEVCCDTCRGSGINPNINIGQSIMLMVTELSEAVEADRKKKFASNMDILLLEENKKSFYVWFDNFVKDTLEDEMADVYLRLYDLCGYLNILPNDVRGRVNWRTENTADRLRQISRKVLDLNPDYPESKDFKTNLGYVFLYLDVFCFEKNIDIEKHRTAKMQYNKSREHLHGKKY